MSHGDAGAGTKSLGVGTQSQSLGVGTQSQSLEAWAFVRQMLEDMTAMVTSEAET